MSHESHNQCLKLNKVEKIRDELNIHFREHMCRMQMNKIYIYIRKRVMMEWLIKQVT